MALRKETFSDPTPDMIERGRRFGEWMRDGMRAKRWNNRELHEESQVSLTYVGVLLRGGVASTGLYQRPSLDIVNKLATALDIDEDLGREAAGWPRRRPPVPDSISLEMGTAYTLIATPTGRSVRLTISNEVWAVLEAYAELQAFRANAV